MSSILIAYNKKKISRATKNKIAAILNFDEINTKNNTNEYSDLAYYKVLSNVQIIYPKHQCHKFKFFKNSRYLFCVSGIIHNEKNFLKTHDNIFLFLIDLLEKSKKQAEDFLSQTKGQFVIFAYDSKKEKLLLANDKLGLYGAYYTESRESLIYSSRAEAITALSSNCKVNYDAAADYLSLGIVQKGETFLKNINSLPAASLLIKKEKVQSKIKKYFEFKLDDSSYSRKKYLPIIKAKLTRSVTDLYSLAGGECQVNLTGGFDTRLINSILLESGKKQNVSFSRHSLEHESDMNKFAMSKDESIGREFAEKFHLNYQLLKPNSNHERGQKNRVELHGLFGGELFGGEAYNQPATLFRTKIPSIGKTHFFTPRFKNLLSRDPIETYYQEISKINSIEWEKKVFIYKALIVLSTFFNNLERYGNIAWQHPNLFFIDDSLAGSKTSFFPYLDTDFLETMFKIPFYEIDQRVFYHSLIEKYYSKYFKIDILHGKKRLYDYNRIKKLYIKRKIDEEILQKKGEKIINPKTRKENGIRDLLDYINNPVNLRNFEKGFFFRKEVVVAKDCLLYYRLKNLQKWFNGHIK